VLFIILEKCGVIRVNGKDLACIARGRVVNCIENFGTKLERRRPL
jgi:flagellar motor switch/type III secretory pathway protein FliN